MKKSLFGLSAVLLAVLFSAFSTKNMFTDYVFQYDGTSYTSQAAVQNPANWDFVSTNPDDLNCIDLDRKACKIIVPASAIVDVNATPKVLKSTAVITASLYDGPVTDTYYVSGGSSVLDYTNQAQ